jgi:hypothetical protein
MSEYTPNVWIVVDLNQNEKSVYKVLAGWYGGYANSDHWKLNSGITKVETDGDYYLFHGYSGSVYRCNKNSYRTSGLTAGILASLQQQAKDRDDGITITIMPEDTNWSSLNYE